jgi:cysteine desulfurase/selenocysteine lyase
MWPNGHRFYRKESWLNKLPAYQGGGEMIKDVSFETTYAGLPINLKPERECCWWNRFRTAVDYMNEVGFENIQNKNLNC